MFSFVALLAAMWPGGWPSAIKAAMNYVCKHIKWLPKLNSKCVIYMDSICMAAACGTCAAMRPTNFTSHGILLCDTWWMFRTGATPHSSHILPGLVTQNIHWKWDSLNLFGLWCKAAKSVTYAAMLLVTHVPSLDCVMHGIAMNRTFYGRNLLCMNYWEVRRMHTLNNTYLWTMSTGKFSSVLNWWTVTILYLFVV